MNLVEQWVLGGGALAIAGTLLWAIGRSIMARLKGLEDQTPRIATLQNEVTGHIQREEHTLWPKVDDLLVRVTRMESNMPNGELRQMLSEFSALKTRMDITLTSLEKTVAEIQVEQRAHNKEAEPWKQRIIRLEDRLFLNALKQPSEGAPGLKPK